MRRWRVPVAAVALSLLGGCSVVWPLAVGTSGDRPVVSVASCSTEKLQRLVVERVAPGGDSWPVVWQIAASTPVVVHEVTVGEAPTGFTTQVALATPLADDAEYEVTAFFSSGGPFAAVRFTPADLRDGQVFVEGRLRTVQSYEQLAAGTGLCGQSDFSFSSIFVSKFGLGLLVTLMVLIAGGGWLLRAHRRRLAAFRRRFPTVRPEEGARQPALSSAACSVVLSDN